MNIEQILRTFPLARDWIGVATEPVARLILSPELIDSLDRKKQENFGFLGLEGALLARIYKFHSILSLHDCEFCDLDRARKLAATTQEELFHHARKALIKENHPLSMFLDLGLPIAHAKRDERIVDLIGPFYDALNESAEVQIEEVAKKSAQQLYAGFTGYVNEKQSVRARFAWALAISDDELKRVLALPIAGGQFPSSAAYTTNALDAFAQLLRMTNKPLEEAQRKCASYERKHEEQRQANESARRQIGELQSKLSLMPSPAMLAEYAQLKTQMAERTRVETKNQQEYDDLKREYDLFMDTFGPEQKKLRAERDAALKRNVLLEERLAKKEERSGLANGTGIAISAGKDLQRRYSELAKYQPLHGTQFFDDVNKYVTTICRIIKDGGRDAERSVFSFEKEAQSHFYKANDGTRIFLSTDWVKTLVIRDVTTPHDHKMVSDDKGRYSDLLAGRAKLSPADEGTITLQKSIRELAQP